MKRIVPAFGVPLILAVGLTQGDTRLPALSSDAPGYGHLTSLAWTPMQAPKSPRTTPKLHVTPLPKLVLPSVRPPRAPGDAIPRAYMVYGLRTGPGGMAFTDRSGAVIPVPSAPNIYMGPFNGLPIAPPPMSTTPRLYTYPPPAPKK